MSMKELVLVDGTYELFRAFYGAPSRKAPDGREIGAALSCARSLWSLSQEARVGYMAVAFDSVIESFRNELFAGYKTGEGIDPDLRSQFPLIEALTAALGMSVLSMKTFEADDALATLAAVFAEDPTLGRIVIASPDKDLAQCVVGQRIVTWDRMRKRVYDEAAVIQKYGVAPASIPDYLALVGDVADGIPGVPRWGARSAARILSRYGRLENIPRRAGDWDVQLRGAAALAEQLMLHEEEVRLYRRLATLRRDVPIASVPEDYRPRAPDPAAISRFAAELDSTWLRELGVSKRTI